VHYYQPGWTMVGGGIFEPEVTARTMGSLIPRGVHWIKAAVSAFEPANNALILDGCRVVKYNRLIVAPGLKLDWDAIEGLPETLGRNGVTSNYRYDLAPYTWELVKGMKSGKAIFTQPPMPIKCAGAPQKALYLSAITGTSPAFSRNIDIEFCNAGGVLFGVKDYVPALENTSRSTMPPELHAQSGQPSTARRKRPGSKDRRPGNKEIVEKSFDMIHVVPAADRARLHPRQPACRCRRLGRCRSDHAAPQDLREHLVARRCDERPQRQDRRRRAQAGPGRRQQRAGRHGRAKGIAHYDGYGSCPLTVERGKIVLAEFGYGGKLLPSFPKWLIDGTKPSRLAWLLKERCCRRSTGRPCCAARNGWPSRKSSAELTETAF
jgi:sulfide:quinone oxidoreductase